MADWPDLSTGSTALASNNRSLARCLADRWKFHPYSQNINPNQYPDQRQWFDHHRCSTQRGPPQRPVNTTQAPCLKPWQTKQIPRAGVWDFLTIRAANASCEGVPNFVQTGRVQSLELSLLKLDSKPAQLSLLGLRRATRYVRRSLAPSL